jgi:hypothetical protein
MNDFKGVLMPPGKRPPRTEDSSYNAYGSKGMKGKFAGVKGGRQAPARPVKPVTKSRSRAR